MTKQGLVDWLISFELTDEIASRPLAVNAWERALESTHLPDLQFRGVVNAFKCLSTPYLDNLDLTP